LLRVIQDGEFERLCSSQTIKVNVRILAAVNRNLEQETLKGHFRSDLWYRLNVFPITVPPLREHLEDMPLLVDYYIKKISKKLGKTIDFVPRNVMTALMNYHWLGNVRELENILDRAVINTSGQKLRLVDELKKLFRELLASHKTLEAVERDYIVQALEESHWKVSVKSSPRRFSALTEVRYEQGCENWELKNLKAEVTINCQILLKINGE